MNDWEEFTETLNMETLAGQLLQRARLCTWLVVGLEPGTIGFRVQVAKFFHLLDQHASSF